MRIPLSLLVMQERQKPLYVRICGRTSTSMRMPKKVLLRNDLRQTQGGHGAMHQIPELRQPADVPEIHHLEHSPTRGQPV